MSIKYSLYPVPTPRGKESEQRQYWSARVKSAGLRASWLCPFLL